MPRIGLITPVYHSGSEPYHVDYDNLPLRNIIERQCLINACVDNIEEILQNAQGTQGSIANRINQSLDQNGDLLVAAVDATLHNIGAHEDANYLGVDYVRMTLDERTKLAGSASDATSLQLNFETSDMSTIILFSNDIVNIQDSESVTWTVTAPNFVQAHTTYPDTAAHEHHYEIIPTPTDQSSPDYTNYTVPVPFIDGSLRVYINGIKISNESNGSIYVYTASTGPSGAWQLTNFTSDAIDAAFVLNRAIDPSDTILVDFDRSFI